VQANPSFIVWPEKSTNGICQKARFSVFKKMYETQQKSVERLLKNIFTLMPRA